MRMNPRVQGALGEISAMEWLGRQGYAVFFPVNHSPDVDLVAVGPDEVLTVQVKTSTVRNSDRLGRDRWEACLTTSGGNQSWNGIVRRFSATRCDRLFVTVGDGRRWFIPSAVVAGTRGITLGGPKYSEYEVEPGAPLRAPHEASSLSSSTARRDSEVVKRTWL